MTLTQFILMLSRKREDGVNSLGQDRTVKVIDKTDVDALEFQLRSLDEYVELRVMPCVTYSIEFFKRHSAKGELAAHPIDVQQQTQRGATLLINTLDRTRRVRFWMLFLLAAFGLGAISYGVLLFGAPRAKRARVMLERVYIRASENTQMDS
jgi:hypothetical protein